MAADPVGMRSCAGAGVTGREGESRRSPEWGLDCRLKKKTARVCVLVDLIARKKREMGEGLIHPILCMGFSRNFQNSPPPLK